LAEQGIGQIQAAQMELVAQSYALSVESDSSR
jgi:hypothetical protein